MNLAQIKWVQMYDDLAKCDISKTFPNCERELLRLEMELTIQSKHIHDTMEQKKIELNKIVPHKQNHDNGGEFGNIGYVTHDTNKWMDTFRSIMFTQHDFINDTTSKKLVCIEMLKCGEDEMTNLCRTKTQFKTLMRNVIISCNLDLIPTTVASFDYVIIRVLSMSNMGCKVRKISKVWSHVSSDFIKIPYTDISNFKTLYLKDGQVHRDGRHDIITITCCKNNRPIWYAYTEPFICVSRVTQKRKEMES